AGLDVTALVTPSGSAGMQAGLIVGLHAAGSDIPVLGINVSRSRADQETKVVDLVDSTATTLDLPLCRRERSVALGHCFGSGYDLSPERKVQAVRLFSRTEGILLDPVYTGQVAAGLSDLVRQGEFGGDDTVGFMHAGGVPGLYART